MRGKILNFKISYGKVDNSVDFETIGFDLKKGSVVITDMQMMDEAMRGREEEAQETQETKKEHRAPPP